MEPLSGLVASHERALVRVTAAQLYQDACELAWPGPWQPELHRRICFMVAAIAPGLPYQRLSALARYARWSILLDDRLDGADPDPAALDRLQQAVTAVTRAKWTGPDPVLALLARILDELARYDRSGAAVARVGTELRDAVASGVEHALLSRAVIRRRQPPPTAEQYLAMAARTVNYRSFAFALLAAGSDVWTVPAPPTIDRPLWHAAYAVRLSNDLRSVERDRAEQTLNVLCLHTAAGAGVTPRFVRAQIGHRLRAHDDALAGSVEPGQVGAVLTRGLRLSVGLYRLTDLR
jgi:Terpene synthase family 2, C-terminal metal binding